MGKALPKRIRSLNSLPIFVMNKDVVAVVK